MSPDVSGPGTAAAVMSGSAQTRVVASISGGKDSAATSLWLLEQGIEHERVFFDTGWEHPATYDYIRGTLTTALGPIRELRADPLFSANEISRILSAIDDLPLASDEFWGGNPMVALCLKKAMFPSLIKARWCTDVLKRSVAFGYFESLLDCGIEVINCVGIRAEESKKRAALRETEVLTWSRRNRSEYECLVWRPLLRYSIGDVISIHRRHGLPPNPLYLIDGIERVGCAPCIEERKSGIRALAKIWPERFELLRQLELAVGRLAAMRLEGQEIRNPNWRPPAWFMASGQGCIPIEQVVRWSRTLRGGKVEDRQERLFASHNDGCMRWGLCDTGASDAA